MGQDCEGRTLNKMRYFTTFHSLLTHRLPLRAALLLWLGLSAGCARNHYYVEPNGQVTSVSHNPLWGPKKGSPQAVVVAEIPTTVAGAKVIQSPHNQMATSVAGSTVVNPAIPEAVVVQQPANGGSTAEPGLVNTGEGSTASTGTQVSGGIKRVAKSDTGGLD